MNGIPPSLRDYLLTPSLQPLWSGLRERLERTGHALRGSLSVPLDDDGADRLSGLLGRAVPAGETRIRLVDLDTSLRSSVAGCGLVAVVADLTGGPLRNRPAERDAARAGRQRLWAHLDLLLTEHNLATQEWVPQWTEWCRRGGLLTRLPVADAITTLSIAVQVLARVLDDSQPPTGLAELASEIIGDAHGLDGGVPAALGLVTHLTVHELQRAAGLTRPGEIIHACENPQVRRAQGRPAARALRFVTGGHGAWLAEDRGTQAAGPGPVSRGRARGPATRPRGAAG
jgi:hypothetical protein